MSIPVIAVSSRTPHPIKESYYKMAEWKKSVSRFGQEPIILGMDGGYHGLLSRAKLLRDYLRSGAVKEECMIWSDAWDVIFVQSPEFIVEQFKATGADISINCERNCWPDASLAHHFPQDEPYPYLNTGFFVGYTEAILQLMEESDCENDRDYKGSDGKWVHFSEQLNIQKAVIARGFKGIHLDTKGAICNTLVGAPDGEIVIEDGVPYNKDTCLFPSVLHCNGGKDNFNWHRVLEWFGRL